ncbi:ShlB/FhaC/HecB family hemolysin secretion/activation protein [uncultured Cedecea sp.]|uniref:ShlB/FhaC/HecB family hemolysin secretion/activation protein n=1 Tax=uncultured Cedecea sp. TaxID=988762 RepID=UPI00261D03BC|nr:ShlB/FhaC/HecB family hemolysin secretion/activation protein [uncultured Cedecea sp.]
MDFNKWRQGNEFLTLYKIGLIALFTSPAALAEVSGDKIFQRQAQQQDVLQQRFEASAPDIRLQAPDSQSAATHFPQESVCFDISRVEINGTEAFPHWVPFQRLASIAVGQCLGVKGINQLISLLQNRLVSHGWITSRVLVPEQDLSSGTLQLTVYPGVIRQVRYRDDANTGATLYSAMPAHSGNLLDLRDIEQGLENLQRIPTVQASMDIEPGDAPGESDIVITRQQTKPWRINAWVDNTGTDDTGKSQAGLMLAWDNPTTLSDLLYVTVSQDLLFSKNKGSTNYSGHYSVPFGYWQLSFTGSDYEYKQTVAGLNNDIEYTGKSRNLSTQLSRLLFRNNVAKTTLSYGVNIKETRNYVNNTEIENQKRRTSSWKVGLDHRQYLDRVVWDTNLSYQRGTRWFGAMPAFEEYRTPGSEDYATALAKIVNFSTALNTPFTLGEQAFQYRVEYNRQLSSTPLTPQDQFSLGGRWTVRGFDGERTLSSDSGWTVKNTLTWQTPIPQQSLYLGVDYGHVSGHNKNWMVGQHLAGGAIGLQGVLPWHISYDLSVGTPFSKPDGFKTDNATFAFSLNWAY